MANGPTRVVPRAAPPWVDDVVLAGFGLLVAIGWIDLRPSTEVSWPKGFAFLALFALEHFAFVHRLRGGLARIAAGLPGADITLLEAALPFASYGLFVGSILRAAARFLVLAAALRAFGQVPDQDPSTLLVLVAYVLPMTAELTFAMVWSFTTMRFPQSKRQRQGIAPRPASGKWTWRQIERWHRAGPLHDIAANTTLLVWSCLLYGAACQALGAEMADWSQRPDPVHPAAVGAALVVATAALTIPLQITLHLDSWLERAAWVTTAARRWQLRASAFLAMAIGLAPAWLAFGRSLAQR